MAKIKFRKGASFEEYCPFPVGTCLFCLYDPNEVWPGTTWHKHGEGHYLVSAGDTYKANSTYGSNTHTLTIDEMPNHGHPLLMDGQAGSMDAGIDWTWNKTAAWQTDGSVPNSNSRMGGTGGGQAHNNMPLSIAMYLYQRTA